ncbi:MAG: DUF2796 domain-containing protein [Rhodospirillales bacterium]|jgi:hypothetical protein
MEQMMRRDLTAALVAFVFIFLTIFFTVSSRAADRNPEAHEHGVGAMNIAIQGNEVEIELELPADNVVGFEHEARTAAEKKRVQNAAAKLKKAANVVVLPEGAACKLKETEIKSALLENHDEYGHKDNHDDHGKSEKHDDGDEHSEFAIHYHFECAKTALISILDISLFKHFPSTYKLRVQYITPNGQGVVQATPKSARIKLN